MSIKYKTRESTFGKLIEKVQVDKETDKCVWVEGRRNNKRSYYDNFFDSFEEAKAFLEERAETKVNSARRQLELAKAFAGNVKGLKE